MMGQVLEPIPSQVQYVLIGLKINFILSTTRNGILFFFLSPQALVGTSQGQVQTQVLLEVWRIPSQVSYLEEPLNFGRLLCKPKTKQNQHT